MASFNSVAVIGGGAYGTALACAAMRAGRDVVLYARNTETVAQMLATRRNPKLPGASIDQNIDITADILAAARADIILLRHRDPRLLAYELGGNPVERVWVAGEEV